MFVIKRIDQGGGYLRSTPDRRGGVWTRDLMAARVFMRRSEAEAERCPENEKVVTVGVEYCRRRK